MEEEGKKQVDSNLTSSSSSLADDIFGPKRTPSDNTVFGSIFPSPSQPKSREFDKQNKSKEHQPQEQSPQPCHLSSSIYYGGRDVYSSSDENKDANSKSTTLKKDGGEDDPSGSASRGNWWQGSLYY